MKGLGDSRHSRQLACWAGAGSAKPALEELCELFADRRFNERRGVMHYLGDEPIDVSSLPTLKLPDTVLFPDESATLTVSRTDPLLRLVELGDAVVQLGDAPNATIVKFRPGFGQPGEDDDVLDEVCTHGTVSVTARYGPGEASLHVLTSARVIGDQGEDDSLGRNPAYPVFGACADFPELRENFVKLISESPGIDAVPGSNLLDTLEAIKQVGREYDRCRNERPPTPPWVPAAAAPSLLVGGLCPVADVLLALQTGPLHVAVARFRPAMFTLRPLGATLSSLAPARITNATARR